MSPLRDALTQYVALRRALGTQLQEPAKTLCHFVEFLEREGAEFITSELALRGDGAQTCATPHGRGGLVWSGDSPHGSVPSMPELRCRHDGSSRPGGGATNRTSLPHKRSSG